MKLAIVFELYTERRSRNIKVVVALAMAFGVSPFDLLATTHV